MYKLVIVLIFSAVLFFDVCAQTIFEKPKSNRVANYDISVNFTPDKKLIEGKMQLKWFNKTSDTITNLHFHTYMNAFKNSNSTLLKPFDKHLEDWGWVQIQSIEQHNGDNLSENWHYISPNDNNQDDQTVVQVDLKKPVFPGDSIILDIDFQTDLPELFMRSGNAREYFFVGQWYPKIGVYEKLADSQKGEWKCHQYHSTTEFYADFGVYNIDITLPKEYEIGATGVETNNNEFNNGKKTVYFHAEDVIDFVWTASPKFIRKTQKWEHVEISLLIYKEHIDQAERFFSSAKKALEYLDENVGHYPYPNLTIVCPPVYGIRSAGMEYPCLITTMTSAKLPKHLKTPEITTIHEFGHQYFMQMVATNEAEEAWLDEGITTYFEIRIVDEAYGNKTSVLDVIGFGIGDKELKFSQYANYPYHYLAQSNKKGWEFQNGGYGMSAYNKPAMWLFTLEGMVGRSTMDLIFQTYFERWKFKHPKGQDFIDVVNEVVTTEFGDKFGANLNWFFDQMLNQTITCDYKVLSVIVRKEKKPQGYIIREGKEVAVDLTKDMTVMEEVKDYFDSPVDKNSVFESEITVHRVGDVVLPVEVLIHFENGDEVTEKWDGKSRVMKYTYHRKEKVLWAKVDPKNQLWVDTDRLNNSYVREQSNASMQKWTMKFLFWVQNAIQFFAMMV